MTRKLTKKQEMFCKEYLIDLNAKQAAIRAGYSKKTSGETGYENLNKPQLREYIQKLMDKRSKKVEITAGNILNSILDIRDTCSQKFDLKDAEGKVIGKSIYDINGALKANELLGKHLTIFDNTKIKDEKTVAETEYIKTKTSILKGDVKDVDKLERIMKALGD